MPHCYIQVKTNKRGTYDITHKVNALIEKSVIPSGLCNLFIQHTSASLILCENADPDVRHDLEAFMAKICPDGDPMFTHTAEGKDDMPAHVRSVLTQTSLTIPIQNCQLALGVWQGVYLWEHRTQAHKRQVLVTF